MLSKINVALHKAATKGHTDRVNSLLEQGADLSSINLYGETPLHRAALGHHTDTVNSLLEKGADPNIQQTAGQTPLHYAARGYRATVHCLLEKGADPRIQDIDGRTPLYWADMKGCSPEVVKSLVYCLLLQDPEAAKPTDLKLDCWESVQKAVGAIYALLGEPSNDNDTMKLLSTAVEVINHLPHHLQPLIEQIALNNSTELCPLAREVLKRPLLTLPESVTWNLIQYLNIYETE